MCGCVYKYILSGVSAFLIKFPVFFVLVFSCKKLLILTLIHFCGVKIFLVLACLKA